MKTVTKKNFLPILCCTYTIISLGIIISEAVILKKLNPTQLNLLSCFVLSFLAIGVLSQHYRFERFSLLAVIIMQYVVAVIIVLALMWILGHFIPIHPDGYHDMLQSFTVPYVIGAGVYYTSLKREVKKQNQILKSLKVSMKEPR
ncbi:MAG: DUF6608 family protein [Cellulosilyticaceae bacterium]